VGNYHKTLYERASGDYVLNLDGDDWLIYNSYISEAVDILCNDDNLVCVFAKIKYYEVFSNRIKYNSSINKLLPVKMSGEDFYYMYVFYDNISVNHLTLLYNRQKAMEVGFYEENIIFSDAYSFAKLIKNSNLAYINKFCGVWRNHGNNTSLKFSTEHIDINENINFEDLLAHINLIIKYYIDSTFKKVKYTKWAMSYKVNTLYPHVSSMIKNKKYNNLPFFFKELKKYDRTLVFPLIIMSIKKMMKFIFKVFIRKIKSSFKKLYSLIFNKIRIFKICLLEENISIGKNVKIGKNVIIKTTDNGKITIKNNVSIESNCYIYAQQGEIIICKNTFIGYGSQIVAKENIKIGDDCLISSYTIIRDANHGINRSTTINLQEHDTDPILIEDDVWIGSHSVITSNTIIGKGAVIGANAVVTKNIESYTVVGGVPTKLIKKRRK
jgi:galactoside O-acetyltransferase